MRWIKPDSHRLKARLKNLLASEAGPAEKIRKAQRVSRMWKVWLLSAAWIIVSTANPLVQEWLAPNGDLTGISLPVSFIVVGVVGLPLGVGFGRLGALREAAVAAVLSVMATAAPGVESFGPYSSRVWTPFSAIVVALLFVVLALPLPGLGLVLGWALRDWRGSCARHRTDCVGGRRQPSAPAAHPTP
ncbi:hypothetical protein [Streptomyces sp. RKAG293]|uniref:hypothetical protein n=1 Tax=Streptomyces sp. RKAG293 TaxID=2893403 RepID=UPI00203331B5|nr:hypothetical protein [Streptomyces sp. RKAG293]MCM2424054.1 hypothetical protein [Streptomyces sp. RKAG293]